jgi:hypothetical protein
LWYKDTTNQVYHQLSLEKIIYQYDVDNFFVYDFFEIRKFPITKKSKLQLNKAPIASEGVSTIGSLGPLKLVLSNTGTPVKS